MSFFGPDYVSLLGADIEKNCLFERKVIERIKKKTFVDVPCGYNAILFKQGEYVNVLPEGRHLIAEKREKGVSVEIVFVSRTSKLEVKWGTPVNIDVSDKDGNCARLKLRGYMTIGVVDARIAFMEFVDSDGVFNEEILRNKLRSRVCNEIQPSVVKAINELGVAISEIENNCEQISQVMLPAASEALKRDYGLVLDAFVIEAIIVE